MNDYRDIIQNEYEESAKARRILAFGKTSGGSYVEIQVDSDGKLVTSGGGGGGGVTEKEMMPV